MTIQEELLKQYHNLDLMPLPEVIKKNGYVYKLIERNINKCLYAQHDGEYIIAYELFITHIVPYRKNMERFYSGNKLSQCPEFKEAFPSDEDFGKRAWSLPPNGEAQRRFAIL